MKGVAHRPKNNCGYACMTRGWTEWNWVDKATGEPISLDAALEKYGFADRWDKIKSEGERLTDLGRKVLKEATNQ